VSTLNAMQNSVRGLVSKPCQDMRDT
jgi:hypothetical protein